MVFVFPLSPLLSPPASPIHTYGEELRRPIDTFSSLSSAQRSSNPSGSTDLPSDRRGAGDEDDDVCMAGDDNEEEEEEDENSLQRSLSIAFKLISFKIGQERAFSNLGNISTICMYVCMYVI